MRSSLRKTRHAAKCAVAVFLVSVAARAQSASEVRKGRLLPVNAREATRGAISPDGRWFAYSVVLAHDRQIWLLDQATGTTRLLTPLPHAIHAGLAWAPNSRRLSYVKDGVDIHIIDVTGDSDRIVHAFSDRPLLGRGYINGTRWLSDGVIAFTYIELTNRGEIDQRWRVAIDGSVLDSTADSIPQRANYRPCCGGAPLGLWLGSRCVAGPLPRGGSEISWDPNGEFFYFVTDGQLYAVATEGGPAHRVGGLPSAVYSLSISADGRMAVTTVATHDSVADLWMLQPPLPVTEDTLARCPGPPDAILQFVRTTLRGWRSVTVVPDSMHSDEQVFVVDVGDGFDFRRTKTGVLYGSRVGWLDTSAQRFHVRATDHALYRKMVDGHSEDIAALWRQFLLGQEAVPPEDLLALADAYADLRPTAAESAAISNPATSRETILGLAMTNHVLALQALRMPRIRNDPSALVAISRSPRLWNDTEVFLQATAALTARAPLIVQDSRTEEPVMFALALGDWSWAPSAALAALMLQHPAGQGSPRTLAVLALRTAGTDVSVRARERLATMGTTVETELAAINESATQERIPPNALATIRTPRR
jgi:hypothetical protein